MIGYCIGLMGIWYLQDALASIAFYPNENWRWNHTARIIRAVFGITLIVLGAMLI